MMRGKTLGAALVAAILTLGACQQGPGGTSTDHPHDPKPHSHAPTARVATKYITLSTSSFGSTGGTVLKAAYSMPEITAETVASGIVEAYYDLGSGGTVWAPLPDTIQFTDLVTGTLGYVYRRGQFEVSITSPDVSARLAIAQSVNGHRVKVLILAPVDSS